MSAAFVFIGARPQTDWLGDAVARDQAGFIVSGPRVRRIEGRHRWHMERDPFPLETSLPGVFVAGDVRDQSIKRVASAVGEGSMAVQLVHQYLGGILTPGRAMSAVRLRDMKILGSLDDEEIERLRGPRARAHASPRASSSSARASGRWPSTSSWRGSSRRRARWPASRCS